MAQASLRESEGNLAPDPDYERENMIRKLKNIGIAVTAALALTAVAAPPASATEFHTGIVYALSGSQTAAENDVATFKAGTVKCSKINYTGEVQTSTSSTLTLAPSFSGCTAFGFVNTPVDSNGCEYVFHTGAEGSTEIVCPSGKSIVVTAFNCWITIGPQSLKSVTYISEKAEGSSDIRINTNLTGMTYTQHSKSFPYCGNGVPQDGTFNNGTSTGVLTLKAAIAKAGIWYE